jgi:formate dehydrogenase subunit delta
MPQRRSRLNDKEKRMNIHHLVTMANQIGSFFASYPDQEEASSEIASHLQRFWAPQMRRQLLAHVAEHGGEGLQPAVLAAIQANLVRLTPAPARGTAAALGS